MKWIVFHHGKLLEVGDLYASYAEDEYKKMGIATIHPNEADALRSARIITTERVRDGQKAIGDYTQRLVDLGEE